jgi:hypothetical protein
VRCRSVAPFAGMPSKRHSLYKCRVGQLCPGRQRTLAPYSADDAPTTFLPPPAGRDRKGPFGAMTGKRRTPLLRALLMTIVLTLCALGPASPAHAAAGEAMFQNIAGGQCLAHRYQGNGKYAGFEPCRQDIYQIWQAHCADPTSCPPPFGLRNRGSGLCLQDVFEGLRPRFAPCSSSSIEQKWYMAYDLKGLVIMSAFTHRCLAYSDLGQGPEVTFSTSCSATPDQRWNLKQTPPV